MARLEVFGHAVVQVCLIHAFVVQKGLQQQVVFVRHRDLLCPGDQQNQWVDQQNLGFFTLKHNETYQKNVYNYMDNKDKGR